MSSCRQRFAGVGVVVALSVMAVLINGAPSSWAMTRTGSPAGTAAAKGTPKRITAKGTLPRTLPFNVGAALADGSRPFTVAYRMAGDLTGQVTAQGTIILNNAKKTLTRHMTGKFVGRLKGVGPVTLTFVTTLPATSFTAAATEAGTATGITGKVKGYTGTIVNKFPATAPGGKIGATSYTVTLQKKTGLTSA